jgi:hypothetical protein
VLGSKSYNNKFFDFFDLINDCIAWGIFPIKKPLYRGKKGAFFSGIALPFCFLDKAKFPLLRFN